MHVIVKREFVDGIETILNGVRSQNVVVIEALVGAIHNKGAVAIRQRVDVDLSGEFEHVVLDGLIHVDADVPNTSGAGVVHNSKLTMDFRDRVKFTSGVAHEVKVLFAIHIHAEGHLRIQQVEEVRVGREVVVAHRHRTVGLVVEGPLGGTHPSASRTEAQFEGVDRGHAVDAVKEVEVRGKHRGRALLLEADLNLVLVRRTGTGNRNRHRVEVGTILILVQRLVGGREHTVACAAYPATRVVVNDDSEVVSAIILVRLVEGDDVPITANISIVAAIHQVSSRRVEPSGSAGEDIGVHFHEVNINITGGGTRASSEESDGLNLTSVVNLFLRVNLLSERVVIEVIIGQIAAGASAATNLHEAGGREGELHHAADGVARTSDARQVGRVGVQAGAVIAEVVHGAVGHHVGHRQEVEAGLSDVAVIVKGDDDVLGAIIGKTMHRDLSPSASGEGQVAAVHEVGGININPVVDGGDAVAHEGDVNIHVTGLGFAIVLEGNLGDVARGVEFSSGIELLSDAELVIGVRGQVGRHTGTFEAAEHDLVLRAQNRASGRGNQRVEFRGAVRLGIKSLAGCGEHAAGGTRTVIGEVALHNDGDVVNAIIVERRVEGEGRPFVLHKRRGVGIHQVGCGRNDPVGRVGKSCLVGVDHVDVVSTRPVGSAAIVEGDAGNGTRQAQFFSSVNLLGQRMPVVAVARQNRVCRGAATNLVTLRLCEAHKGQHKRHHQRKYFLFHNELNLVNNCVN